MEYRNFGSSDLKVSAIGFGCWEVGGQHHGVGGSETVLGKALGAKRNDIVLVSTTRGRRPGARPG